LPETLRYRSQVASDELLDDVAVAGVVAEVGGAAGAGSVMAGAAAATSLLAGRADAASA
jgi:hypothetical protein